MMKLLATIFIVWAASFSLSSRAVEAPWYQVELLVFANLDPTVLDDEFWPSELTIPSRPSAVPLKQPASNAQSFAAYEMLPSSALLFNEEKGRIARYQTFRVLFHGGWLQPVTSQQFAQPVHIRAGNMLDNGMYELEGFVTIDKGRYLHFRPDLYHSRRLSEAEAAVLRSIEEQAPQQFVALDTAADANQTDGLTTVQSSNVPAPPDFLTINMKQGRRMRSQEVHYLDHPLLGILVLMMPIGEAAAR